MTITQQPQTGLISRFYRQVENRLKNRVYLIAILVFFLSIMSHISVGSLFSLIVSWQTLEIVLVLA